MQELINNILFVFQRLTWGSVLDILLVAAVFSVVLYLLRDTEAQTLIRGILMIFIFVFLLTSLVSLPAFSWLFSTISPALILVIPVIFTPEIRHALERLGNFSHFNPFWSRRGSKYDRNLDNCLIAVTNAVVKLSEKGHGALIVIRRRQYLDAYYKNGVMLDAEVQPQTLMQIFYPNTPLHDGAVIIDENRIKAASCVMPLSSSGVLNSTVDRSMGLRHRAALGISEVSDAVAVVVSEETGTISIAFNGRLIRRLDGERLLSNLRAILTTSGFGTIPLRGGDPNGVEGDSPISEESEDLHDETLP